TCMGFRIHQGGSQAYFGIDADIVTYGKIIGGGMPIGVVAGKAKFMDVIDGGHWNFGDDSYPTVQPTLFAGTFCRHPLTMAAAYSVLKYMQEQGPQLQEKVNQKAQHLADSLNRFFAEEQVPIRVRNFGSLFLFESFGKFDLAFQPIEMNLFFYLLIRKGVYTWERRICCLSTAHTDEQIQYVIKAVQESIKELRAGGFSFSAPYGEENQYPLTPAQQQYFILNQIKELGKAVHLTMAMTIKGPLQVKKLESAVQEIANRHDILRVGFEMKNGEIRQQLHDSDEVEFSIIYKKAAPQQLDESIEAFLKPFDLSKPPLIRIGIVEMSADYFLLIVDSHHIISDGESADILVQDLIRLYQGSGNSLPPIEMRYKDYMVWWQGYLNSPTYKTQEKFWVDTYSGQVPQLHLPLDFPRADKKNFAGGLVKSRIDAVTTKDLKQLAKASETTLFMLMLAAYFILLNKLSQQEDIMVGIPVSLRSEKRLENIIGFLTNNLALRAQPGKDKTFVDFLKEIQADWMKAYSHKEYPYERLVEKLQVKTELSRNPLFDAMFIYENVNPRVFKIDDLACSLYYFDTKISIYDFILELSQEDDFLDIKLYYSTQLFKKETIEKWSGYFIQVLVAILNDRNVRIGDILKGSAEEMETALSAGREKSSGGHCADRPGDRLLCPPANEIERKLIEIWQQELNIKDIGTGDNFFELGGRSFGVIRTISKINQQLGSQVSLAAIFEFPTVKELALRVEKTLAPASPGNTTPMYPGIPAAPPRPAYELSPGQMRYWVNALTFSRGGAVESSGIEITADVIILEGTLDYNRLRDALIEAFKRHDIMRTIYTEQNSKPVQIIHQDMNIDAGIPIEYDDLSGCPPEQTNKQLSERLLQEYSRRFELKTWPLFRFFVYKIGESRHILFCNAPHINFDGWSFTIILEETAYFYQALKTQPNISPLPALPVVPRYVDYVEWNKERLTSPQLQEQADYWTQYLTRKIPVVHLPYDYDDETAMIHTNLEPPNVYQFKLSTQLTEKLYKTAANDDTTLFVTVLAILEVWIAALANQNMITVGTIFSGRTYPTLEKIPGIMMNLMPVRLDLSGNPNCREILSRTRKAVLETYLNQDYPLDLVAHKMRKVIDINRDIYSIMFIGQEAVGENVHFDGLKMASCPLINFIHPGHNDDEIFLEANYNILQDLIVEMFSEDSQIKFIIRYNNRRFRSQTIKKYFDRFKSIAEQFLSSADLHFLQLYSARENDPEDLF
ncbi:MAG TPA: aminotransferase class III-fold pyridoxal phosphate-dependent enzyme, partial [Candidatus Deferrimicrobium sp.]|nr:aminotransferase class III-fold pyridoxal phosphate-dependent enzyme [Candidatus Deferrimicrobium sp.]